MSDVVHVVLAGRVQVKLFYLAEVADFAGMWSGLSGQGKVVIVQRILAAIIATNVTFAAESAGRSGSLM
jgi:hypothetical protein